MTSPADSPSPVQGSATPASPVNGCGFSFSVVAQGYVHIHNHCGCGAPGKPGTDEGWPQGGWQGNGCLPVARGAKPKASPAARMAARRAAQPVASALATSTLHAIRRHLAGKEPANAMERALFARLDSTPERLRQCMVAGFDATERDARSGLFGALPAVDRPVEPTRWRRSCSPKSARARRKACSAIPPPPKRRGPV